MHGAVLWMQAISGYIGRMQKNPVSFSSTFMKELGVGTGVGLRFDVSFLVLRLDVAFLRKRLPEPDRWVIDQINFGSSAWLSNLVLTRGWISVLGVGEGKVKGKEF